MNPDDRYKLNEGAKEYRLKKFRAQLDGATAKRGTVRRMESEGGGAWMWVAIAFAVGVLVGLMK